MVEGVAGRYAPGERVISSRSVAMATTSLYPVSPNSCMGIRSPNFARKGRKESD
jgi:hypothetical protein